MTCYVEVPVFADGGWSDVEQIEVPCDEPPDPEEDYFDPIFLPEQPVYPDSYTPNLIADPSFGPDASLGFSGGDVAPFIPGSRFRVFDY